MESDHNHKCPTCGKPVALTNAERAAKAKAERSLREWQCQMCGARWKGRKKKYCCRRCMNAAGRARRGSPKLTPSQRERKNRLDRERRSGNPKLNARRAAIRKARYYADPGYRLEKRVRTFMWRAIDRCKKGGYALPGGSKTMKLLGCSIAHLRSHIESKWDKGMSWSNHGDWHIDHIIPLSSASTQSEITHLCHYTNLRPVWALENLKKHNKIETCQPELTMAI